MAISPDMQNSKHPELIYRGYRPGDEKQITRLMMPHWKGIKEDRDWIHEFIDSPDGPCISRICEVDGRIVGHNGLILMQMTVGDKTVLGGKAEGAVISEEYRKAAPRLANLPPKDRPIFLNLSRQLWERAMALNVAIMFGFPTRMALYGHLGSGWDIWVLREQGLIRPISTIRSARLLSKKVGGSHRSPVVEWLLAVPLWLIMRYMRPLWWQRKGSVVPVNSFDDRIDHFWQSLAERHQMISIKRTFRHLNWRFAHAPYVRAILVSNGQLRGYGIAVTRDVGEFTELQIVDLVIDDGYFDCLGQILRSLIEQAGSKIDFVTVNCFHNGCAYGVRLNSELKKYFLPATRVKSKTAILKVNPLSCDDTTIRNPTNWFINAVFAEMF
jgi:hypothetical protein